MELVSPCSQHVSSQAQAQCCKGSDEGAESFCYRVLDPRGRGAVPLSDVRSTLALVMAWATGSTSDSMQAVDAMLTECVTSLI